MAEQQNVGDQDAAKGAMECDREDCSNTSMAGQNPHRTDSRLVKDNDSDFPEPGSNPEHSGQQVAKSEVKHDEPHPREAPAEGVDKKAGKSPDREQVNQDPGHRQKENQNDKKDDSLAA